MATFFNRAAALQAGMTDEEINKYLAEQKAAGNNIVDDSQKAQELLAAQQPQQAAQPETKKERSILAKVLPILGAVGGGLAGAAVTLNPVGAIAGASLGGGLGEGAAQAISGEDLNAGSIVKETALGGVGELTGMGVGRVIGLGGKLIGRGAKGVAEGITDTAISGATKFAPSGYQKALESGVELKGVFKDAIARAGGEVPVGANPVTELVGRDFKGGLLNNYIKEAEDIIQSTSGVAGNNIRIDGADVVKAIRAEAKNISSELGGANRKEAISAIVKDAEKKYAKGFTVKQGLTTLRTANEKFGSSIFAEAGDAVASAAQKLEADVVRNALKTRFPSIEGALADQQKYILLREALKKSYSKAAVAGSALGKVNIARPGSVIDQFMNNPRVGGIAAKAATGAPTIPSVGGINIGGITLGRVGQSVAGQGVSRSLDQQPSTDQGLQPYNPVQGIAPETTSTQSATLPNGQTVTIDDFKKAALEDLQTNGGKNLDKIKKAQELIFGKGGNGLELSDTAIKTINDLQGGIQDLTKLYTTIDEKNLTGPVRGLFANIPGNVAQQTLQAEINRIKQTIGKALEGGVLRKEDEEKYKKILPTMNDPKEVALSKMKQLYQKLNEDLTGYITLQKGYGTATTGGTPVTDTTLVQ